MTADHAISLAESARWTVVGTSQRSSSTTLYLKTPMGRAFQLTVYEGWDEATVNNKLEALKQCPF